MNEPILFTPQDLINAILAICGAITVVAAAATVIAKMITSAKRPNKIQDEKIAALEKEVEKMREDIRKCQTSTDDRFKETAEHVEEVKEANAVTQRAILALLSHAINGNDVDNLRRAKEDLENYLTNKKG